MRSALNRFEHVQGAGPRLCTRLGGGGLGVGDCQGNRQTRLKSLTSSNFVGSR